MTEKLMLPILFKFLDAKKKIELFFLQILSVLASLISVASVALMIPFLSYDQNSPQSSGIIAELVISLIEHYEVNWQLYNVIGTLTLITIFVSTALSSLTIYSQSKFAFSIGSDMADRILHNYLNEESLFHMANHSSSLVKNLTTEVFRITQGIILQALQILSSVMLILFMVIGLIVYQPIVASTAGFLFVALYSLVYLLVRVRISKNGQRISAINEQRYAIASEVLVGIRDVKVYGKEGEFERRFSGSGQVLATAQAENTAFTQLPKYFVELFVFGSLLIVMLYSQSRPGYQSNDYLEIFSIFGLAAIKMLPAFQRVFSGIANIKGNMSAFDQVKQHIYEYSESDALPINSNKEKALTSDLTIKNCTYCYPNNNFPTLDDFSFSFSSGGRFAIVGESGAGKSTLVNILLGFLQPQVGSLYFQGQLVASNNLRNYRRNIGYVGQEIHFFEGTLAQNISLDFTDVRIDVDKLSECCEKARILEFIHSLPSGFETLVTEGALNFSGGQRQRIGIARALYRRPRVIVFDEATSALDSKTEMEMLGTISELPRSTTIIMVTHRLDSVHWVDQTLKLADGRLTT